MGKDAEAHGPCGGEGRRKKKETRVLPSPLGAPPDLEIPVHQVREGSEIPLLKRLPSASQWIVHAWGENFSLSQQRLPAQRLLQPTTDRPQL